MKRNHTLTFIPLLGTALLVLGAAGCKKEAPAPDLAREITTYESGILDKIGTVENVAVSGIHAEGAITDAVMARVTFKVGSGAAAPAGSCLALSSEIAAGKTVTVDCAYKVEGLGSATKSQDDGKPQGEDSRPFRIVTAVAPASL